MRCYYPLRYLFICLSFFFFTNNISAQEVKAMIDASDLAIAEGAYIEALGTLSKVLEADTDNSEAHNLRGVCFEKLEQFENASEAYRRAIKSNEAFAAPYFNLGLIYMAEGKEHEAIELFDKYIRLKPEDAAGWTQKGITYLFMERLDSALFFLNRAIDMDRTAHRAFLYRGYSWSMINEYERAIEDLDAAVSIEPSSAHYYVRADLKMEAGDVKGAITDFTFALEKEPMLTSARLSRANAYMIEGRYDECLEDVKLILKEEPGNDQALNYQSWAHYYKKDYQLAIVSAKFGNQMSASIYNFDHILGRCYLKTEQFEEAKIAFEKAIQSEPKRTDNYQLRAAAILFTNSELNILSKENGEYFFKEIHSNSVSQLNKWVNDPYHAYYYPRLLEKYNTDFTSLSYDEYFMFYFGFTEQPQYQPYAINTKKQMQEFDKYFAEEDYEAVINSCEAFLKENPFVIEPYLYAGSAHHKLGQLDKYGEYMFKYHALLESIKLTGDGKSPERAFIVCSPADEYDLLYYLGYNSSEQALLHQDGHEYDVLQVNKNNSTAARSYLYFNVDKPYRSLLKDYKPEEKREVEEPRVNVRPRGK